jgi:alcohol dehydrogenase
MLPSLYQFHAPVKILSGRHALDNIPHELGMLESSRPLIITDRVINEAGLLKHLSRAMAESSIAAAAVFDDVPPDSSSRTVSDCARVYSDQGCDSIIAVGGGSVIDTAKGANILVSEQAQDLLQFSGADRLTRPLRPLVVVPTTAGTGSEATCVAVITNEQTQTKMAFTSPHLLPHLAVLDPRMTQTMPARITAATGMDALSHAMEACTCLQRNPPSTAFAHGAIRLISEHLVPAVQSGRSKEHRLGMANAALLAGIAFSNSMVGMVHSLGHAAGGVCHIPHGVAMAIFLPFGLETNLEACRDLIAELLLPLGGEEVFASTPRAERAEKTIAAVRDLQHELHALCGLPLSLQEAGVPRDRLGLIARTAIDDPSLILNPVDMDYDDALSILKRAF